MAASCASIGTVRVWDAATGTQRYSLARTRRVGSMRLLSRHAGRRALRPRGPMAGVRLWNRGKPAAPSGCRRPTAGRVWGLSFSPDGKEVASAGGDQTVRYGMSPRGPSAASSPGLRGGHTPSSTTQPDHTVASQRNNTVGLLDAQTGADVDRIRDASHRRHGPASPQTGRRCVSRRHDVRLWEVASGNRTG